MLKQNIVEEQTNFICSECIKVVIKNYGSTKENKQSKENDIDGEDEVTLKFYDLGEQLSTIHCKIIANYI